MFSLLVLAFVTGLTFAYSIWLRSSLQRSRRNAFVLTCLYCVSLLLALRVGGRTYPGIYFPNSGFLNALLNGNVLFTGVGYAAVLVAGTADSFLIFTRTMVGSPAKTLKVIKWIAVSLATAIALFGFYTAAVLQRLPN